MKTFSDYLTKPRAIPLIHGTDWWTDCDDCMALRLVCRAHTQGVVRLLGIAVNAVMADTAPSISAMLCDEGTPDIPVGMDFDAYMDEPRCVYQPLLAGYEHKIMRNEDCEDACRLYRRLLAASEEKVLITEVGFAQILMDLLKSPPDDISPLSGEALVREKVDSIWMMAGCWDRPHGMENNFIRTPRSREGGAYLCAHSPVPLTFLGWELGDSVRSGGDILSPDDLLYKAMEVHGSIKGRSSWDPMLVIAAILDDLDAAGYRAVRGFAAVDPATGENSFLPDDNGPHRYLIKTQPDAFYQDMINALIASK